jgi:hypothetical protein
MIWYYIEDFLILSPKVLSGLALFVQYKDSIFYKQGEQYLRIDEEWTCSICGFNHSCYPM